MITFNNTKTIYDLVKRVGTEFENQVFVRYEKDDTIYEKGYGTYTLDTMAVALTQNARTANSVTPSTQHFSENAATNISQSCLAYPAQAASLTPQTSSSTMKHW